MSNPTFIILEHWVNLDTSLLHTHYIVRSIEKEEVVFTIISILKWFVESKKQYTRINQLMTRTR